MDKKLKCFGLKELEKKLKNEKIMFCFWDCENKDGDGYQNWCLPIEKLFKKTIFFDFKEKKIGLRTNGGKEIIV